MKTGHFTLQETQFGMIDSMNLTQSSFSYFMHCRDNSIRDKAYHKYYGEYKRHEQIIANLLIGSMKNDIFKARIRGHKTSLEYFLNKDNVSLSVLSSLIDSVHAGLDSLHNYYLIRKKALKLNTLHHYDVYVSMVELPISNIGYNEACKIVKEALSPLGVEYTNTMYKGITSQRWVDKYENIGKQSYPFSCGGYVGNPYILLNYRGDSINDVYTLGHECSHSMHTIYSRDSNPFLCYNYTAIEAEIALQVNEQLITEYLLNFTIDEHTKAYIIAKQLDGIVASFFRQTMLSEFELISHTKQENGDVLTPELLREIYKGLLDLYFGKNVELEDLSYIEYLTIPHLYDAFCVYKYATGLSVAINISQCLLKYGGKSRDNYIKFLKGGGSKPPTELLKMIDVDITNSIIHSDTIEYFKKLMGLLEKYI